MTTKGSPTAPALISKKPALQGRSSLASHIRP